MQTNNPFLLDLGQGLSVMLGLPALDMWGNDNRPQKAKKGTLGFNSDTSSLEYYDGTDWYAAQMSTQA